MDIYATGVKQQTQPFITLNYRSTETLLYDRFLGTEMNIVIDNMESLLYEAHKTKGWKWVQEEPLWVTWPMEKFGRAPCMGGKYRTNDIPSHIYT